MVGFHTACGGEIHLLERRSSFDGTAWSFLESTWECNKCALKFYNPSQLKECLEPPLHLRWLTNKQTGMRHLALTTDPSQGEKLEP